MEAVQKVQQLSLFTSWVFWVSLDYRKQKSDLSQLKEKGNLLAHMIKKAQTMASRPKLSAPLISGFVCWTHSQSLHGTYSGCITFQAQAQQETAGSLSPFL